LQQSGLQLVTRNFRCRFGEIDLVMRENDTLVFVEVRQRSSDRFGSAAASITPRKQQRLLIAAQVFLRCHPALAAQQMRFDVIAIDGAGSHAGANVQWLRNAIGMDGRCDGYG
jgi:putative endonuclease